MDNQIADTAYRANDGIGANCNDGKEIAPQTEGLYAHTGNRPIY